MLGSGFRENRNAGDLVSEVPRCGELAGLKLKRQHENTVLSLDRDSKCWTTQIKPYLNGNVGVEGTAVIFAGKDWGLVS